MSIRVEESSLEEIENKLSSFKTDLSKISYLESVLNERGFSFEIKRFIYSKLSEFYERGGMLEKAARAMANRAGIEVRFKDKIDSYVNAGEYYAKIGKVDDAENMFIRATREANSLDKAKVLLARKNIYLMMARKFYTDGKRASALKFYEKLIKIKLEEIEKREVKTRLIDTYRALGRFKDAQLIEGA